MFVEWASKTEPQSVNYMGNYDFTHNAENPFSTGNGYANALIGVFNTYTELTNRVDRDRRHWQTEGYLQDSWRMNRRLTLDYGVRFTHSGGYYDARKSTAGFLEPSWNRQPGAAAVPADLHDRRAGQPDLRGEQPEGLRRRESVGAAPERVHRQSGAGHRVADQRHGCGRLPGDAAGRVLRLSGGGGRAPGRLRVGHQRQWQAGVAGVDRDLLRHSLARCLGGLHRRPAVVLHPRRPVRDVRRHREFRELEPQFVETPINVAGRRRRARSLEKSYNVNVAYQRDIGFSTTAEVAYVGSFTYTGGRTEDINRPVNNVYLLGGPEPHVQRQRTGHQPPADDLSGHGSNQQWIDQSTGDTVNNNTLRYNSVQVSVQRRLNRGLQVGMAYTLAKGEGWTGYSPDILEADPTGALNRLRFWGPTSNNRTHNLTVNYSYLIPNALPDTPVLKWLLGDWQVSGVTKYLSGTATQPACTTTNTGIANTNPTLTPGATFACMLTGEPVFEVTRDPDLPEEDQPHFNPRAFTMPQPLSATVGNFGNVPLGILRNPGWWNWDLTVARRFPVPQARSATRTRACSCSCTTSSTWCSSRR